MNIIREEQPNLNSTRRTSKKSPTVIPSSLLQQLDERNLTRLTPPFIQKIHIHFFFPFPNYKKQVDTKEDTKKHGHGEIRIMYSFVRYENIEEDIFPSVYFFPLS